MDHLDLLDQREVLVSLVKQDKQVLKGQLEVQEQLV